MRQAGAAAGPWMGRTVMVVASMCALLAMDGELARAGDVVEDDEGIMSDTTRTAPDAELEVVYESIEAHEDVACDAYPSREPEVEPLWKLGRGLHNMVFGLPAEIVRNPVIEILKADTIFGVGAAAFEGVVVGVGKGFWRVGAGFLDVVTFPVAIAPWYHCDHLPKYPF